MVFTGEAILTHNIKPDLQIRPVFAKLCLWTCRTLEFLSQTLGKSLWVRNSIVIYENTGES